MNNSELKPLDYEKVKLWYNKWWIKHCKETTPILTILDELCKEFGTPSITLPQILAALPEKSSCRCKHMSGMNVISCICGSEARNAAIDQAELNLRELFK